MQRANHFRTKRQTIRKPPDNAFSSLLFLLPFFPCPRGSFGLRGRGKDVEGGGCRSPIHSKERVRGESGRANVLQKTPAALTLFGIPSMGANVSSIRPNGRRSFEFMAWASEGHMGTLEALEKVLHLIPQTLLRLLLPDQESNRTKETNHSY